MKISIITATINSAAEIKKCIESVNEQTYDNIEHIIIDGASTDDTIKIIQSLPNRISKLVSEFDNGIYNAFNKGIKYATGDIIGFLHADDAFGDKHTVEHIIKSFQDKKVDGVFGDLIFVKNLSNNKVVRNWKSCAFKPQYIKYGWAPPHPTLFLKKEIYQQYGSFNSSYRIAGDYDFMLRIFLTSGLKFHYLPEVITKMSLGGVSTRFLENFGLKSREDMRALRENGFKFPLIILSLKKIRKIRQLF